jgi:hypothetical protein
MMFPNRERAELVLIDEYWKLNHLELTPNNLAISRLVPSPRSTASTIRFRKSNEYAIALLKAISSTHSTASRCKILNVKPSDS